MADYRLTDEGWDYLQEGLPEANLAKILKDGPLKIEDAKKRVRNFGIALQWLKKMKLLEIKDGKIQLVGDHDFQADWIALKAVYDKRDVSVEYLNTFLERKLVEKVSREVEALEKEVEGKEIVELTPEMIKTGAWKKSRGFAPYNKQSTPARKMFQGKIHPYRQILNDIREKLVGLGFTEARGPYVESEFWNFDTLFIPQEHPARSGLHDRFIVEPNAQSKIEGKDVWDRVKATHEFGWITGSKGWGNWNASIARKLMLRSHNTVVSARTLSKLGKDEIPYKMFAVDRVFRKDVIDASHLIDFDQCEGIIVGENLNFRHLLGYLKEIGKMLGVQDIRFKPSYFPFTEPSLEIYAKIEGMGWIESGGAGIMRPEVTVPLGVEVPVLAFGIGIGRLAMIKLGINDIRQLYSDNIQWLREKNVRM